MSAEAADRVAADRVAADRVAADHEARRVAQRELRQPLAVEAGAGTGKTATLVARILAWCLDPGWERAAARLRDRPAPLDSGREDDERIAAAVARGVVAITFTEAAATEMAERVARALATVRDGGLPVGMDPLGALPPEVAAARAAALLAVADELRVRTIHGFCRRLLADHPFAAGVHPAFTVDADGGTVAETVEETVAARLSAVYGDPGDADWLLLAGAGLGPRQIADALEALLAAAPPDDLLADDPTQPPRLAAVVAELRATVDALATLLAVRRPGPRARNAAAIASGLATLRRRLALGQPRAADLADWLSRYLPPPLRDHLAAWSRGVAVNAEETRSLGPAMPRLRPLAARLLRLVVHLEALDLPRLAALRRVLAPLHAELRETLRVRGVVGFGDLLRRAHALLAGDAAVRARVRRGIDQLLVDEFQDTDTLQCELVRLLALDGPPEERPGLFVVGDPKQSIYGWRSADLAAYEAMVTAIEAAGGRRLELTVSFRATKPLLAEVDRLLAPVMLRRPGLQPDFRSLVAARDATSANGTALVAAGRAPVEHWISWSRGDDLAAPEEGGARATAELEALAVAADLLELRRAGALRWGEAALLLRSTTDLDVYLGALREARIPFAVSRDRQYYRRREILDAVALVRAVLVPEDALALVTWLRSSAVGVPDAALVPLWSAGFPERVAELDGPDPRRLDELGELVRRVAADPPPGVPGLERLAGWEASLLHALECLATLRHDFATRPADVFVERLRRLTLFEAIEAARYLGAYRVANLERFFGELLAALTADPADRHRVLRRLRERVAQGYEAEEAQPGDVADDAVQVMTIHRAKGLEFAHVYLLQSHKESRPETRARDLAAVAIGAVEGRWEYRILGLATPGAWRLEERREEVAAAERVRTLYVAVTRAAERLVVVGRPPLDGAPPAPADAASHLDLVRHRREAPSLAELRRQWRAGQVRRVAGGVAWVLPGLVDPRPAPWEERRRVVLPPADQLAALGGRRDRDAANAAARSARAFAAPASRAAGADEATPGEASLDALLDAGLADLWPRDEEDPAVLAGAALHRVLESWDLAADPAAELERQRGLLPRWVDAAAGTGASAAAHERARLLFARLTGGELLRRFLAARDRVVARELPVILAAAPECDTGGGPLAFSTGVVDLLLRDDPGELVVVDYKAGLRRAHADAEATWRRQGALYVAAVAAGLGLPRLPRFEVWLVAEDRVVEVSDLAPPEVVSPPGLW